jgi:hypothetical protein
LAFPLPQGVPAGTRAVQLGSPPVGDEPPVAVPGSSPQTLAVRPAVVDVSAGSATLRVQVAPAVIPGQSVAVALISVSGAPAAATFGLTASAPTAELDFPLVPTPARAAYLVVLSVDGVASLPGYANGLLSSPLVSLR